MANWDQYIAKDTSGDKWDQYAVAPEASSKATATKPKYKPALDQINPKDAPVLGTTTDVLGQFSTNFADQLLAGLVRPALKTYGYDIPKPTTTAGNIAGWTGGVLGFGLGAPAKLGALAVEGASKLIPRLAEKGLANAVTKGAIEGATSGLSITPDNTSTLDEVMNMKDRAKTAANFAALGMAMPVVAKGAEKAIEATGGEAGRVINSLIKPLKKDFSYGKNPGKAVAEEGITANNFEELAQKIGAKQQEYGQKIRETLLQPENQIKQLNLTQDVNKPIDEAIAQAKKFPSQNQTLINRLEGMRDDLLGVTRDEMGGVIKYKDLTDISPLDAAQLKTDIGKLTKWTGNPSDDKVANKILKTVYGNIKEKINQAVPEIAPLNEKYADLTSAKVATEYRDIINQRQNMLGFNARTAGLGGALLSVATGHPVGAIAAGTGGALLDKFLASPTFKTQLAKGLMESSKVGEKIPLDKLGIGTLLSDFINYAERPVSKRLVR